MSDKRILGIDPGFTGGLVLLVGGVPVARKTMPTTEHRDTKGKKHTEYDEDALVSIFQELRPDMVFCEKIWAMNKGKGKWHQGVSSVFSFGQGYGTLRGIIAALHLKRRYVAPTTWQALIFRGMDRSDSEDTKEMAQRAVQQRWPGADFRDPDKAKSRVPHSGICDAACIALYGHLETL